MEVEVRGGIPAEIRAEGDTIKVSGHAAVFNQTADIAGLFQERFLPGAFRNAIANDDVVFLINHDGLPLARTRSGTLTLSEDETGLRMQTELDPNDPDVQSIVGKMRRGDLDKMSIAFRADLQEWDDTQDPPLRTIKQASLADVSVVTNPAYDGTDIGLRSLAAHRKQIKEHNFHAARRRLRMKMDLALKERENGQ